MIQMGGAKTEEEEVCSRWEGGRPRKKKCVPDGRGKDRERGSVFQMGGAKTEKKKSLFQMGGAKTEEEEVCSRWKGQRQRKPVPNGRGKDRKRSQFQMGGAKTERGSLFQMGGAKTEEEEVCSSRKGQRQKKTKSVVVGRAKPRAKEGPIYKRIKYKTACMC